VVVHPTLGSQIGTLAPGGLAMCIPRPRDSKWMCLPPGDQKGLPRMRVCVELLSRSCFPDVFTPSFYLFWLVNVKVMFISISIVCQRVICHC
jgi:hypothetical protein